MELAQNCCDMAKLRLFKNKPIGRISTLYYLSGTNRQGGGKVASSSLKNISIVQLPFSLFSSVCGLSWQFVSIHLVKPKINS